MKLSAGAQQILAQLCKVKGAYLFGARDTDAPFKLNSGSASFPVPPKRLTNSRWRVA